MATTSLRKVVLDPDRWGVSSLLDDNDRYCAIGKLCLDCGIDPFFLHGRKMPVSMLQSEWCKVLDLYPELDDNSVLYALVVANSKRKTECLNEICEKHNVAIRFELAGDEQ